MKKTLFFMLVCLIVLSGTLFAGAAQDRATPKEKILQVGQVGGYAGLAVYRNALPNHLFLELVYDQLLFNEKGEGFKNEAIEAYTVSPDNRNLTFTLKPGLVTHDGSAADADLFIEVYQERVASDKYGASPLYNQLGSLMTALNKIDARTVSIDFSIPIPHIRDMMTLMSISDPDMHIKDDGTVARFNEQDKQIGTGPFRLVEYVPGSHAFYAKFDQYWDAANIELDGVRITFFGDNAAMVAALEAGEVDYIFRPSFDDIERLSKNPAFSVIVPDTRQSAFIMMMSPKEKGITQNPLVRQAINHAINRTNIAKVVTNGMTVAIATPALPGGLAYAPANEIPLDGDMAKARELLAASGEDLRQPIKITYPSNDAQFLLISELVADNMRAVGLNPVLDPMENAVYTQKRLSGEFQLLPSAISGLNVHPAGLKDSFVYDPSSPRLEEFFNPALVSAENRRLFERYKALFTEALIVPDVARSSELFQQALGVIKEGAWVTTLCVNANSGIASSRVRNLTWTNQDKPVFTYVDLAD